MKTQTVRVGKVDLEVSARRLRAYQAKGRTVAAAADLLVTTAEGKGWTDTVPNRIALLSADDGAGHRQVEEELGLRAKPKRLAKSKTTKKRNGDQEVDATHE